MCSWPVSRNIITGNTERDYGFLLNHVGVVTIDRPLSGVSGQTLPQASSRKANVLGVCRE